MLGTDLDEHVATFPQAAISSHLSLPQACLEATFGRWSLLEDPTPPQPEFASGEQAPAFEAFR